MRPLMAVITPSAAGDDPPAGDLTTLLRGVAAVHIAALPLLIPTWAALGAGWWLLSPSHSPRDLAVLSLAVYLVVTPSHEALVDFLARFRAASLSENLLGAASGTWTAGTRGQAHPR